MKKRTTLLLLSFALFTGAKAQDVDYTANILNSDFEYATAADFSQSKTVNPTYLGSGTTVNGTKYQWKPLAQTPATTFYGWTVDFTTLGGPTNQSQGINNDASGLHGSTMIWIGGNVGAAIPENFEFYQTLAGLPAGTYKVQCLLGVDFPEKHTSQRIFANNNVQYFGKSTDYVAGNNLNTSENYTFAGYSPEVVSGSVTVLKEMKVYSTIAANNALKIGIRTGGKNASGATAPTAAPFWGWYKVDYFRLTKIDPAKAADATLRSLSLSAGSLTFDPATTTYTVNVPAGTTSVTPTAAANIDDATITGTAPVTLSNGSGASTITVKALDGTTTKVYTINYTINTATDIKQAISKCSYSIKNNSLTVNNVASYAVFSTNGIKVADIKANSTSKSVHLSAGIYIIKTNTAETFKITIP